jgi:hypothetical protein
MMLPNHTDHIECCHVHGALLGTRRVMQYTSKPRRLCLAGRMKSMSHRGCTSRGRQHLLSPHSPSRVLPCSPSEYAATRPSRRDTSSCPRMASDLFFSADCAVRPPNGGSSPRRSSSSLPWWMDCSMSLLHGSLPLQFVSSPSVRVSCVPRSCDFQWRQRATSSVSSCIHLL